MLIIINLPGNSIKINRMGFYLSNRQEVICFIFLFVLFKIEVIKQLINNTTLDKIMLIPCIILKINTNDNSF
jgi:hypothetical protein